MFNLWWNIATYSTIGVVYFFGAVFKAFAWLLSFRAGRLILGGLCGYAAYTQHTQGGDQSAVLGAIGAGIVLALSAIPWGRRSVAKTEEAPEDAEGVEVTFTITETTEAPEEAQDEAIAALDLGREEKRLAVLLDRKDKLEYLNRGAGWAKFETTKTWRGLLYDIEATERKIRLLKGA